METDIAKTSSTMLSDVKRMKNSSEKTISKRESLKQVLEEENQSKWCKLLNTVPSNSASIAAELTHQLANQQPERLALLVRTIKATATVSDFAFLSSKNLPDVTRKV